MEKNQNEKFAEAIKEFRGTIFEYSSSDSDEEDDKSKFDILSLKKNKAKSSMNLPVKWKNPKTNKNVVYLSRYVRMVLFLLLLIFSVIIDLDSGIIGSSYKSFTKDLNMSDIQFGTLSSITTVGEIIGLLFYMSIINKNHRKFILVTTSLLHGIGLFGYLINSNFYYISILNFLISVCKAFINVYMPVWIDQFGIKKYKTLLLTILYMAISMGMILGAWIGTVLFNNDWKKSFICEGLIFIGLSASLFAVPQKYYSTKYMIVEQQKISGNPVEKIVPTKDDSNDSKIKKNIENVKDIKYIGEDKKPQRKKQKMEKIEEEKNNTEDDIVENNIKEEKKEKLISDNNNENKAKKENKVNKLTKNLSLISKLKAVFINQVFIFSCLAKAIIFFIYEIIYIFFKIYAFEALHYDNEIKFFYYYSITTIAAPSLGGLVGGAICNKFFGGYESKKSVWIILFFGTISVVIITLVRVTTAFNKLIIYIFGFFFSASAFLPTLSGYIINSLNKDLKGFGSSFDNLITNLFVLSSPILYGLINDKFKKEDSKYAWNKSMMIYYFESIFIYLACFYKWKTNNKKIKRKNSIVKKTMKDAYKLGRSSLVRADKPKPKFNEIKNLQNIELENLDDSSSYN
jgi:MFS family permease